MITVCSIFRNSAHYIDRYFKQMAALDEMLGINLVLTHGDSIDVTGELLTTARSQMPNPERVSIAQFDHGGPRYGSVDHPERWDQIAKVVRFTLDRVSRRTHMLMWVEADLVWEPDALVALFDDLQDVPTVAPQLLAHGSTRWYDTWGYRMAGLKFDPDPPYHGGVPDPYTDLVHIDSCGSCWVTRADYWRSWSGHWPFNPPDGLWLDPNLTVWHP